MAGFRVWHLVDTFGATEDTSSPAVTPAYVEARTVARFRASSEASSGPQPAITGARNTDDMSGTLLTVPAGTSVDLSRPAAARDEDCQFNVELVEWPATGNYAGSVLWAGELTMGVGVGTADSPVIAGATLADCFPDVVSVSSDDTGRLHGNRHASATLVDTGGGNIVLRATRGVTSASFSGRFACVQVASGVTVNGPYSVTPTGALRSDFTVTDVVDWNQTVLISSRSVTGSNLDDTCGTVIPGADTTTATVINGTTGAGPFQTWVVYTLTAPWAVRHWASFANEPAWVEAVTAPGNVTDYTVAEVTVTSPRDETMMRFGVTNSGGADLAPRQYWGADITVAGAVELHRGYLGNNTHIAGQLVDTSPLPLGGVNFADVVDLAGTGTLTVTDVHTVGNPGPVPPYGAYGTPGYATSEYGPQREALVQADTVDMTGTGTLTVTDVHSVTEQPAMVGQGTLEVTERVDATETVDMSGTGTLTVTDVHTSRSQDTPLLTGTGTLTVTDTQAFTDTVDLTGTGTLTVDDVLSSHTADTPDLVGTGALSVTDRQGHAETLDIGGTGTLTVTDVQSSTGMEQPAMTGTGTLEVTDSLTTSETPDLAGTGTLTVTDTATGSETVDLAGTGTLTVTDVHRVRGAEIVDLAGTGTLTVDDAVRFAETPSVTGTGTLEVTDDVHQNETPAMSGTGTLEVTDVLRNTEAPLLAGSGTLTVTDVQHHRESPLVLFGAGLLVVSDSATAVLTGTSGIAEARASFGLITTPELLDRANTLEGRRNPTQSIREAVAYRFWVATTEDPAATPVQMALVPIGRAPRPAEWVNGSVVSAYTDGRILVEAPLVGRARPLDPPRLGRYGLWVRLNATGAADQPHYRADSIEIIH